MPSETTSTQRAWNISNDGRGTRLASGPEVRPGSYVEVVEAVVAERLAEMLQVIFEAANQPGDAALFNAVKHAERSYRESGQ